MTKIQLPQKEKAGINGALFEALSDESIA